MSKNKKLCAVCHTNIFLFILVGDESIDGSASTNSDSKPKELEGKERPTQKLRFPSHITAVPTAYPTLQSTPSSSLSSPMSGKIYVQFQGYFNIMIKQYGQFYYRWLLLP